MRITKKTNLNKLVTTYPETADILLDYGLHCVGCFANEFDSIEDGCRVHGYDDKSISDLVSQLNEFIKENSNIK